MFIRSCLIALLLFIGAVPAVKAAGLKPWEGRYVGLSLGAVRTDGRSDLEAFDGVIIPFDVSNGIFPLRQEDVDLSAAGGFFAGYGWQRGGFAFGVEADVSVSDLKATASFSRTDENATGPSGLPWPFFGVTTTTGYSTELDALATLRLRVGFVSRNTLVYATGGLAGGSISNRFSLAFPGYNKSWTSQDVRLGYVLGLGVEHAFSSRIGLRAELIHFDLRDTVVRASDPETPNFELEEIDYRFANRGQTLRVGLSFRF